MFWFKNLKCRNLKFNLTSDFLMLRNQLERCVTLLAIHSRLLRRCHRLEILPSQTIFGKEQTLAAKSTQTRHQTSLIWASYQVSHAIKVNKQQLI